jgi:nucleoside-diphosphate-sugar epimerase
VDDVVSANLACCSAPVEASGRVYNVARGDRLSIVELARMIIESAGAKGLQPQHVDSRAGDVRDSQADAARARELLGWQARVGFAEGLRRTIEWFSTGTRA